MLGTQNQRIVVDVVTRFVTCFVGVLLWLLLVQWLFGDPIDVAYVGKVASGAVVIAAVAVYFYSRRRSAREGRRRNRQQASS